MPSLTVTILVSLIKVLASMLAAEYNPFFTMREGLFKDNIYFLIYLATKIWYKDRLTLNKGTLEVNHVQNLSSNG